ncbi:AUX/IAA family [Musa troglodytarum]|uniref:Auxin-responsive protein n=1 Tax=Musa troglodytarum TaxID=320322 RepID=A0A9E7GQL2_9LILI|nr:AUX/IAA family [Musa troglodytarum]
MKATVLEPPPKDGRREVHEDRANKTASGYLNNLELRLGMSLVNGQEVGDGKSGSCAGGTIPRYVTTQDGIMQHQKNRQSLGGAKRCFSDTTGGFVDPWSLAARQETAALEQAHQQLGPFAISRSTHPPQAVGWPPVCSFRKNLGDQNQSKSTMSSEANPEKIKVAKDEKVNDELQRPTMFVKVNMEANYLNNPKQDEKEEVLSPSYILLYEDSEGDRMLVGDVPWELITFETNEGYRRMKRSQLA